jgi:putative restriction endonuclease
LPEGHEEAAMEGRNVRFRLNIVAAYNYTCALTRYRLTTISGKAIVDAAHIHQYAKSHNNDISNGMALSKSAHWLFDEGLWSLTDDYRVIVADEHFAEHGPEHILLRQYRDQQLHLPSDPQLWPSVRHITWHRNKKFKGVAGS